MSVRAALNENEKVLNRESRANYVGLDLGQRLKFQQEYELCGMEKYAVET